MREFGLLIEIYPSLPLLRPKATLDDDYESSLSIESNFVDNAPLTNLKEVFNSPLTSLPFVAQPFSSTPLATTASDLTLLASLPPLA